MVFGLFSRKPALEQPVQQLRTPSPSLPGERNDSNARLVDGADSPFEGSPAPCPPPASPSPQPVYRDAAGLRKLIAGVPAQTLHEYTLTNLRNSEPSQAVLIAFSKFFDQLAPPPKLHCIRCHKEYFEIENNDRSCTMNHDDDSAEVERVGFGSGIGTEYETLWRCCDKTVEGDGDMGPPDGWCFEGMHTTDPKRARFRADADQTDDKLQTCAKLRCSTPVVPASPGRAVRAKRARTQSMYLEDLLSSDDASDGAKDSGVEEIVNEGEISTSRRKSGVKKARRESAGSASGAGAGGKKAGMKGKGKLNIKQGKEDMDVDGPVTPPPAAASPRSPGKSPGKSPFRRVLTQERKEPPKAGKKKKKDSVANAMEGEESLALAPALEVDNSASVKPKPKPRKKRKVEPIPHVAAENSE